jgi:hypothetical protein
MQPDCNLNILQAVFVIGHYLLATLGFVYTYSLIPLNSINLLYDKPNWYIDI